jgi:hypothetical protein
MAPRIHSTQRHRLLQLQRSHCWVFVAEIRELKVCQYNARPVESLRAGFATKNEIGVTDGRKLSRFRLRGGRGSAPNSSIGSGARSRLLYPSSLPFCDITEEAGSGL